MDLLPQLQSIDVSILTMAVSQALQNDGVAVRDWQVEPLGGGFGNPVSLGLYRFRGNGQNGSQSISWSLVLKVAQSPANAGLMNMGEGADQGHWNYWRREFLLYQSGLLDKLPTGLAAPRCCGVVEQPGDVAWLWLEEISDSYAGDWPLDRYVLAARHFGRFNGAYLSERPLPAVPWLSTGLLRQWCTALTASAPFFFTRQTDFWEHPLVRRFYPPANANPLQHFFLKRGRFLDALDQLPRTLCHLDTYPTNLMSRPGENGHEQTVAIDWAQAGVGCLGEDLAQLAFGTFMNKAAELTPAQANEAVFAGYVEGLRESGWRGDVATVLFGFIAAAALRIGLLLLWLLNEPFEKEQSAGSGEAATNNLEEVLEQQATPARYALKVAEEALKLIDKVSGSL